LYLLPVPDVGSRFECIGQQRFLSGEKAMFMTIGVANTAVFEHRKSQVRGYCRSIDTIFDAASGSLMRDVDGRQNTDFLSSAGSLNCGHNNPNLQPALTEYLMRDGLTPGCAGTEQQRSAP
jgi:4-aminobutyrate aminotransferase-like enzyme